MWNPLRGAERRLDHLRSRLGRRMALLFFACAVLPVAAFATVSFLHVRGRLVEHERERLATLAKEAGQSILERLHLAGLELERRAAAGEGEAPEPRVRAARSRWLRSLLPGAPGRGPRGEPLDTSVVALGGHLRAGRPLLVASEAGGAPSVHVGVPFDPGRPDRGLLWGEIDPDYLAGFLHPWEEGERRSTLPAGVGLCILTPAGPLSPCEASLLRAIGAGDRPRSDGGEGGRAAIRWRDGDGRSHLAATRPLFLRAGFAAPPWLLVVSEPAERALAPVAGFQGRFLLVVLLTLLLVPFLSQVQIRRSLEPLRALQEGTRRIGRRDFEGRVEVESDDEFEELAHAFNGMADRLARQFGALETASEIDRAILGALETEAVLEAVVRRGPAVVRGAPVAVVLAGPGGREDGALFAPGPDGDATRLPIPADDAAVDGLPAAPAPIDPRGPLARRLPENRGAWLAVPIRIEGERVGALLVGRPDAARDDEEQEDREHATRLADRVAVALANARLVEALDALNYQTIVAFARAIDAKSAWTAGHSERVTAVSLRIGRAMELDAGTLEVLERGALLHDIGKIGIPGAILDKPGRLTEKEMEIMRSHTTIGAEILAPIARFRPMVPIVRSHHERLDGTGYPDGLAGEAIPPLARIVAVADVFDALTSARPYRAARPAAEGARFIRERAGTHFDPAVVEAFREAMSAKSHREEGAPGERPTTRRAPGAAVRRGAAAGAAASEGASSGSRGDR